AQSSKAPPELQSGGATFVELSLQAPVQDGLEGARCLEAALLQGRYAGLQHRRRELTEARSIERKTAGQESKHHHAERPQIGARIHQPGRCNLLGRHELRRTKRTLRES